MARMKVFTGLYACPICEDEFQLFRASGAELRCPTCREELEPVLSDDAGVSQDSAIQRETE